jgi:hypothetical protein
VANELLVVDRDDHAAVVAITLTVAVTTTCRTTNIPTARALEIRATVEALATLLSKFTALAAPLFPLFVGDLTASLGFGVRARGGPLLIGLLLAVPARTIAFPALPFRTLFLGTVEDRGTILDRQRGLLTLGGGCLTTLATGGTGSGCFLLPCRALLSRLAFASTLFAGGRAGGLVLVWLRAGWPRLVAFTRTAFSAGGRVLLLLLATRTLSLLGLLRVPLLAALLAIPVGGLFALLLLAAWLTFTFRCLLGLLLATLRTLVLLGLLRLLLLLATRALGFSGLRFALLAAWALAFRSLFALLLAAWALAFRSLFALLLTAWAFAFAGLLAFALLATRTFAFLRLFGIPLAAWALGAAAFLTAAFLGATARTFLPFFFRHDLLLNTQNVGLGFRRADVEAPRHRMNRLDQQRQDHHGSRHAGEEFRFQRHDNFLLLDLVP